MTWSLREGGTLVDEMETLTGSWTTPSSRWSILFSSAGAWGDGRKWTCMALMSILIDYGFFLFGLTDYAEIKCSAHFGVNAAGASED